MARPSLAHRIRTVHLPFVVVLLVVAVAVGFVVANRWRRGAVVLGIALLVGAVLRAGLPETRAGLLAVRNRPVDVLTFGSLGLAIIVVATSIDPLGS